MRTAKMLLVGSMLSMVAFAGAAGAEEKAPAPRTAPAAAEVPAVIMPVKIVLRAPRPQAATEISKVVPARPLGELRQPFLDRVEKVVEKAPF